MSTDLSRRQLLVAGGALAMTIVTLLLVASFQMFRSDDAKLLTQAAKDKTRAVALKAAKRAECDRLVSEAMAAGQAVPSCAARSNGEQHASKSSTFDAATAAGVEVAKSALLAAIAD